MTSFSDVSSVVLGPLAQRSDADWYRASDGKWSPVQIVHHLALGIEHSGRTFESRREREPMRRRPRTLFQISAYFFITTIGWSPRRRAPPATLPAVQPERAAVERQFREGVERFERLTRELLPRRSGDLFVKHPVLGDLTLPEWLQFHTWHCSHHARQIRERLAA